MPSGWLSFDKEITMINVTKSYLGNKNKFKA
jgi:hypothetical protein